METINGPAAQGSSSEADRIAAAILEALRRAVEVHGCGAGLGKCDAPWCVEARRAIAAAEARMRGL